MKSKYFFLIAAMAFAPSALHAQSATSEAQAQARVTSQTQANAESQVQGSARARIDAAIKAAAKAKVPASMLESKVEEGRAKNVPEDRIATAVEARSKALIRASETMSRAKIEATSTSELSVAADALEAGVSESALIRISKKAPGERRVVAIAVLADLVRVGEGSEPAFARVNAALSSTVALANLQAEVASKLRLGGLNSTLDANAITSGIIKIK